MASTAESVTRVISIVNDGMSLSHSIEIPLILACPIGPVPSPNSVNVTPGGIVLPTVIRSTHIIGLSTVLVRHTAVAVVAVSAVTTSLYENMDKDSSCTREEMAPMK